MAGFDIEAPWFVGAMRYAGLFLGLFGLAIRLMMSRGGGRMGEVGKTGQDDAAGVSPAKGESQAAQARRHLAWILSRDHGVREFPWFILAIIIMFLFVNCMLVAVFFMPKGG
ncbi:hypothetical protein [Fundidesulfovibrio terrae]|uniref:hypothetical protein n=1 Tax=Fundidesulfovibrio terrae TaxID=2922866 RepID=UPI001FAF43AE|nr:hypothetical protein [Fundidesulfovibrio terrae]